jgi:uncharacterized protein
MKTLILLLSFLLFLIFQSETQQKKQSLPVIYNAELAAKLGADDLGMKSYVFAFLIAGPVKLTDSVERVELQKAHLKNIVRLVNEGKLLLAGPFLDRQPLRGFYILDVSSLEEARDLLISDPAVLAGTLELELHIWYGSAALTQIPELHKQIQKKAFGE